jgi:hypothetical protein
MPSWRVLAALGAAAAAAGYALSMAGGGTPVQQTLLGFLQKAMWAMAAACGALAVGVYAFGRYRARKANPYAAAIAVGEPIIRIRDIPKTPRPDRWSVELLRALEWKRFDMLCAGYYGHRQFRVEPCGCSPDGSSEAKLYFKGLRKPVAMLACTAWGSRPVGVKPVRDLSGTMAENQVAKGISTRRETTRTRREPTRAKTAYSLSVARSSSTTSSSCRKTCRRRCSS